MTKIFVLGGTGFLGYHIILELLTRGYSVRTLSRSPMPIKDLLPKEVEFQARDINDFSDDELLTLLNDVDGFIHAAGADDRLLPKKPATTFYYEANVLPTQRLVRLAKKAGVKSFVICGSYFAEFAERMPELELQKQPYIRNRLLQEQIGFAEGEGEMKVTSLRLPYIFGTMPGRLPFWKIVVDQIYGKEMFPALKGGTAMVTVQQVAQAAVGACEKGKHRKTYALGDTNMKFVDFYQLIVNVLGQSAKTKISLMDYQALKPAYEQMDAEAEKNNNEFGVNMKTIGLIQTFDFYLSPEETFSQLDVDRMDVKASIEETVKKSM
ncbi:NAD-dependent epimerase/dehydratase family protein [Candidatus Enterococcus mansonii]|uniref:NAD-dependent epimerase/dehydratase domain-containing protein n=1 Tax=Candidatus Enterococcus mansonii TaxID=1834181 RepID=A0A242CK64_9ENTE|nr:NAD-dependent epimerase/dehydratase family protein [Enterococcus sp. 4G2_DIV0659]OTO10601.1 hypothetical protein A5880_001285 [Enterococcus sp. 4G2_DIV0659]